MHIKVHLKVLRLITNLFLLASLAAPVLASPLYSVGVRGIGNNCSPPGSPIALSSGSPGVSYQDNIAYGPGSSGYIFDATANETGLQARSRSVLNPSVAGIYACSQVYSEFAYDDVMFLDANNATTTVSIDVHYKGTLYARAFGVDGFGQAQLLNKLVLRGPGIGANGLAASNSTGFNTNDHLFEAIGYRHQLESLVEIDTVITHTWVNVPTNVLLSFEMGLLAESFTVENFSTGAVADTNFLNGMNFAGGCDVFRLEADVTAASDQLGLGNCGSNPVPAPAPLYLLVIGLAGLWQRRLRLISA